MPASEAMWTIEPPPCSRIGSKHARATLKSEVRLTSRSSRNTSSGVASIEAWKMMPAFAPATGERDGHALRPQPLHAGRTDTGRAAGDERGLSVEAKAAGHRGAT